MMNKRSLGRSIITICFDAEEKGLLGSKFYTQNPTKNLEQTTLMINMDMIGRLDEKAVTVGGAGSAKDLSDIVENVQNKHSLKIEKNMSGMGLSPQRTTSNKRRANLGPVRRSSPR